MLSSFASEVLGSQKMEDLGRKMLIKEDLETVEDPVDLNTAKATRSNWIATKVVRSSSYVYLWINTDDVMMRKESTVVGGYEFIGRARRKIVKFPNSTESGWQKISGAYDGGSQGTPCDPHLEMEHSAANGKKSQWTLLVKCREKVPPEQETLSTRHWSNITEVFPDAKVKELAKTVHLTLTEAMESYEFAVFGKPGNNDRKRMQVGIFGSKPKKGQDWNIFVTLFDDTLMELKHVCDVEKGRGRHLLTALAGLFVLNSDEDIKISLSMLDVGWQIKGGKIQVIKSKDAWNYLGNSTDFPRCCFEISHDDIRKKSFYCEITASHGTDTAETELVEHFDEGNNAGGNSMEFRANVRGTITALRRG
ncbi:uncharacterized protein [Montipora capricornis]|uniref:uncharacterized protein isoform X2 n=1 Tax=Montipora capricornis TaxID=246305 RepID=UPI0035F13731